MINLIKRCENAFIDSLKLSKKRKYNITRDDGYRVNIMKIRNGASRKRPVTNENISDIKKLRKIGLSYDKIAKKLGMNRSRVIRISQIINNVKYQWKPDKILLQKHEKNIIKLRKKGYSHFQIRTKLRTGSGVVSNILKKHNMVGERHAKRLIQ